MPSSGICLTLFCSSWYCFFNWLCSELGFLSIMFSDIGRPSSSKSGGRGTAKASGDGCKEGGAKALFLRPCLVISGRFMNPVLLFMACWFFWPTTQVVRKCFANSGYCLVQTLFRTASEIKHRARSDSSLQQWSLQRKSNTSFIYWFKPSVDIKCHSSFQIAKIALETLLPTSFMLSLCFQKKKLWQSK